MKTIIIAFLLVCELTAQTNVYLRAGAPQAQVITGVTNATPMVVTTQSPHGFSALCNTSTNICYCAPESVPSGLGASPANGVKECVYVDSTHLSLYDLTGTPIAGNGNWWAGYSQFPGGSQHAQWLAPLTKFVIPANAGALGLLDGTTGDLMRRLSLGSSNGLVAISVSGCPSACVVSASTSYDPTGTLPIPLAIGNKFSITGTGTSLDTCGDGTETSGAQSPYTVASVNSGGWTSNSFACSISNGDYSNINNNCGPSVTPNDLIGGTQSCVRVSQLATTANAWWNGLVTAMSGNNLNSSPGYKSTFDGGNNPPNNDLGNLYGMAAIRFLVDPTKQLWLTESIYGLNNDFRTGGAGYTGNSQAWVLEPNAGFNYTGEMIGLSLEYGVAAHAPEGQYWTGSEKSAFLNRIYNDIDDTTVSACTTTNQDAGHLSNHIWQLSSGLLASGTNNATHAQLPNTDPNYSTTDYYKNTVIFLKNNQGGNDFAHYSYGLITGQSNTGVLTVGSWQGGSVTPDLSEIASATYTSGLGSIVGTTGQVVCLEFGNNSYGLLPLTGTNTIAGGTGITITGPGTTFGGAPTTATVQGNCGSATASGTATVSVTLGTPYIIADTIVGSTAAANATGTVTWTKTASLAGSISTGDSVLAYDGWGNNFVTAYYQSYVTGIGSNSVTAINGTSPTISTTVPQVAWRLPQWTTGDCGRAWITKQQSSNDWGGNQALYGAASGAPIIGIVSGQIFISDAASNGGGATVPAWMIFDLAAAQDDSRAVRDLAMQSYIFDWGIRPLMDDDTGRAPNGAGYGYDNDLVTEELYLWSLASSVPSYPSLALTSAWVTNPSIYQEYSVLPQLSGGNGYVGPWAGFGSALYAVCDTCLPLQGNSIDPMFRLSPTGTNAGYLRNWLENQNSSGSMWGYIYGPGGGAPFLHNDPRIADSNYTAQPLQAVFNTSAASQITSLTGWPSLYRADAFISRTCWTCNAGSWMIFDSPTFRTSNVYDSWQTGTVMLWKGGAVLLAGDENPAGVAWNTDSTTISTTFQFNGSDIGMNSGLQGNIGKTEIARWSGAAVYGDGSSRYAAGCGNEAPLYNPTTLGTTVNVGIRCAVHMKASGHDEFIFQFDDWATSSPISMLWHLHYPQNGVSQSGFGSGYMTGSTALSGGVITSVEDGSGGRTYGIETKIISPGTVTLRDDGSGYTGGNGYTHRFSICASASCGTTVSSMTSIAAHKVMQSLGDTTYTTASVNPDANWTGVVATGAVSSAVGLFARNGVTQTAITGFTATSALPVDWLLEGLTPGVYSVTVGGTAVSGSPFTVASGDNSIYFSTATGGAFVLSPLGSLNGSMLAGPSLVKGSGVVK